MLLLLCALLYVLLLAQSFQPVPYTNTASSAHTAARAAQSSTRLYSSREDELRDKIAKLRKAQGQGKSYEAVMGYVRSELHADTCMQSILLLLWCTIAIRALKLALHHLLASLSCVNARPRIQHIYQLYMYNDCCAAALNMHNSSGDKLKERVTDLGEEFSSDSMKQAQEKLRDGVVYKGKGGFESELATGRRNLTLTDATPEELEQPEQAIDMVGRMMAKAEERAAAAERGEVSIGTACAYTQCNSGRVCARMH
jgi:hypothetical protein